MSQKPLKNFKVYQLNPAKGKWMFWMNARSKSEKQLLNTLRFKTGVSREYIKVKEDK
jgi:hypothetical protein